MNKPSKFSGLKSKSKSIEKQTSLSRLLAKLSTDHQHGSKFLFTAFQFEPRAYRKQPPTASSRSSATLTTSTSTDRDLKTTAKFLPPQRKTITTTSMMTPTMTMTDGSSTSSNEWRELARKTASLVAPVVGQTRSTCQLRFRYSLGATRDSSPLGADSKFEVQDQPQRQQAEYKVALSLTLWSRHRPSIKESGGNFSADSGGKSLLWSRTIELATKQAVRDQWRREEPHRAASGAGNIEESGAGKWAIGVLELGRTWRTELNFEVAALLMRSEAKTTITTVAATRNHVESHLLGAQRKPEDRRAGVSEVGAVAGGRGGGAVKVGRSNGIDDAGSLLQPAEFQAKNKLIGVKANEEESPSLSGLVALDWLEFHNCNWPRESHQTNDRQRTSFEPLELADQASDFNDHTICPQGDHCSPLSERQRPDVAGDPPNSPMPRREHRETSCGPRQFRCSNDICLDEQRLCNFVDDCMSGSPASTEVPSNLNPKVVGGDGNTKGATGSNLAGQVEDESQLLCDAIPGMEDFERMSVQQMVAPTSGDRKENSTSSSNEPVVDSFWSLVGDGWHQKQHQHQPARREEDKLGHFVRDNSRQEAHLPKGDHTTRASTGKFLSLDIPETQRKKTEYNGPIGEEGKQNVRWSYIKSPWMRKLDVESGECRVKFFFNLVTDEPISSDASDHSDLTFKVYLAVDHFVVDRVLATGIGNKSTSEESETKPSLGLRRRVDSILLTHVVDYERLVLDGELGFIEYPGVDFWREVNVNLVDLREGDTFQIRIAIIIELDDEHSGNVPKATINLDDLSTHFGCSLSEDEQTNSELAQSFEARLNRPMTLGEFLGPPAGAIQLPPRRLRLNNKPILVEPQTLVAYVFGVLMLIMGIIATIVFVLVPYVERATMNYQDRISLELNGAQEMPPPGGHSHHLGAQSSSVETRDFTSGSDWERVSRHQVTGGQRSSRFASSGGSCGERRATESIISTLNHSNSFALSTGADSIGSARNLIFNTSDEDEVASLHVGNQTAEMALSNNSNNNFFAFEKSSGDTNATTTTTTID